MEIFSALMTQNPELTKILLIPTLFIDSFVNMLLFTTILNIQTTRLKKCIYVVINSLFMIATKFLLGDIVASIINILFAIGLVYFVFIPGLIKSCSTLLVNLFFGSISEYIAICIVNGITNASIDTIKMAPLYRISIMLLVYTIIFIIYLAFKHFKISIETIKEFDSDPKTKKLAIYTTILGVVAIVLQTSLSNYCIGKVPSPIIVLNAIILLGYFVLTIYSISKAATLHVTTRELQNAETYNKNLNMLHDSVRAFKHDFNNIVQAIGRICCNRRYERTI